MLTQDPRLIRIQQAFAACRRLANPKPLESPGSVACNVWQPDPFAERPERTYPAPRPEFRGPAPAARRMYPMQDQAPDAPAWVVRCAATGVALGRVKGSELWALAQGGLLAASQGFGLRDIRVRRIAADGAL